LSDTSVFGIRACRDHGELKACKQDRPPGSKPGAHEALNLGLVEEGPDIALAAIAGWLAANGAGRQPP
jgi:hypothetical protein